MNLLLVTFSLRNRNKDYSQFFVSLRGNAYQWWHFIEQTCVVVTRHNVSSYAQQLIPHLEDTDSLFIVKIKPYEFQGWLPKEAWDWLTSVSGLVDLPPLPPRPAPPSRFPR